MSRWCRIQGRILHNKDSFLRTGAITRSHRNYAQDKDDEWRRLEEFKKWIHRDPYEALFGRSSDMLAGRIWRPKSSEEESNPAPRKQAETSSLPPRRSPYGGNYPEDTTTRKSIFPEPSYKERIRRADHSSAVVSPSDSRRPCEGTVPPRTQANSETSRWSNNQARGQEWESKSIPDKTHSSLDNAIPTGQKTQHGQNTEKDWRQTVLERRVSDTTSSFPDPPSTNQPENAPRTSSASKPASSWEDDEPVLIAQSTLDGLQPAPMTPAQIRWGMQSGIWPESEWDIDGYDKTKHQRPFKTGNFTEFEPKKETDSQAAQSTPAQLPEDDLSSLTAGHIRASMKERYKPRESPQAESKLSDNLEEEIMAIENFNTEKKSNTASEIASELATENSVAAEGLQKDVELSRGNNITPNVLPNSASTQQSTSARFGIHTALVYDPDTDSMHITTSNESSSLPTIPIHEALTCLESPSKFMVHLPARFDIICAKSNLLVIRESDDTVPEMKYTRVSSENDLKDEEWRRINPVDGTTRLSPTGFVGVDDFREDIRQEMMELRRQREKEKHSEKESAGDEKPKKEKRQGGTASVLKTAIVATAVCYVAGVGGEIGRGAPPTSWR